MTKEDPLKILATDKKKESNKINKMDDVYMSIYIYVSVHKDNSGTG